MKTTFDTNGAFRGRRLALSESPVDPQQKDQLKTLPEADWNPKLNPSTLPYSDSVIADLLKLLKGKKDSMISMRENTIEILPLNYQYEKPYTIHWLRHSDATTHLLESGTDLPYIQKLLDHESSKTTVPVAIGNTHVSTKGFGKIKSRLDQMNLED